MEKIKELIYAVKQMRKFQKNYFETQDFTTLSKAKSHERFVDRLLLELDEHTLFSKDL